jgi:hypothetical protein
VDTQFAEKKMIGLQSVHGQKVRRMRGCSVRKVGTGGYSFYEKIFMDSLHIDTYGISDGVWYKI